MQKTQQLLTTGIRMRLAAVGKSQRWLAEQVGVSQYALSRRMKGQITFDVDIADRIASALDTDFEGLMTLPSELSSKQRLAA
ncbi:MAG: helix-turn-helix transcriptional regulator [Bifidobacterium sp.]|nr:helix-turn-helix transcriptional regulator [Bifidobacterium sp.]